MDACKLPFINEFDLIGAFDVLEHIDNHETVIQNMRTALKPGGVVLLTVPQHPWLWSKADELAFHKRRYTRKQLSSLLNQQGFDVLVDTSFMFFLLPLLFIQRFFANKNKTYEQTKELVLPSIVDKVFEIVLNIEQVMIQCGICFPIGSSRLLVARVTDN
jgi:SAM-dependent methyltransferase